MQDYHPLYLAVSTLCGSFLQNNVNNLSTPLPLSSSFLIYFCLIFDNRILIYKWKEPCPIGYFYPMEQSMVFIRGSSLGKLKAYSWGEEIPRKIHTFLTLVNDNNIIYSIWVEPKYPTPLKNPTFKSLQFKVIPKIWAGLNPLSLKMAQILKT